MILDLSKSSNESIMLIVSWRNDPLGSLGLTNGQQTKEVISFGLTVKTYILQNKLIIFSRCKYLIIYKY